MALQPKLTDEFLATLVEASKVSLFDDFEVDGFINQLFQIAGKEPPESKAEGGSCRESSVTTCAECERPSGSSDHRIILRSEYVFCGATCLKAWVEKNL